MIKTPLILLLLSCLVFNQGCFCYKEQIDKPPTLVECLITAEGDGVDSTWDTNAIIYNESFYGGEEWGIGKSSYYFIYDGTPTDSGFDIIVLDENGIFVCQR